MADKNLLSQMLESLVNDDKSKAEELFHEYVVAASREIYEGLIEAEMDDEQEDEEDLEEGSASEEDEEEMEEGFEDVAVEAGDEFGGDATDDLAGELDGEEGDEFGGEEEPERSEEELFQDLDAIVDELQAKFDELKGVEGEEHGADFGGDEMDDENEGFEPEMATVREYVEKVPAGHGAEKKGGAEGQYSGTGSQSDKVSVSAKSVVAGKNDMGGTTANILSGRNGQDGGEVGAGSKIKGSALNDQNPKEDNAGNVNVPGGNAGKTGFKKKEPGHGAEKKGSAESADNKQSLFRGRR